MSAISASKSLSLAVNVVYLVGVELDSDDSSEEVAGLITTACSRSFIPSGAFSQKRRASACSTPCILLSPAHSLGISCSLLDPFYDSRVRL